MIASGYGESICPALCRLNGQSACHFPLEVPGSLIILETKDILWCSQRHSFIKFVSLVFNKYFAID